MTSDPRTLTDAVSAVRRHVDNGRAVNVDEAAARAVEQHGARIQGAGEATGGAAPQQG